MQLVPFSTDLIPAASALAAAAYEAERRAVPALPEAVLPPLDRFAESGMGVAALEDGRLLGFLSGYPPFANAFTTNATGTWSPAQAHGVLAGQEARVWPRLYQAAAARWVEAGCSSHSITLYAHDRAGLEVLYRYGFGARCMDAIRPMTPIGAAPAKDFDIDWCSDWDAAAPLRRALSDHLGQSPCFCGTSETDFRAWEARSRSDGRRMLAAWKKGCPVAYYEVAARDAEHYCTGADGMRSICGAYCLPELRGTGLMPALLDNLIRRLAAEGSTRLGVDFESFNPTAYGFWHKYFEIYTCGVVRRIDESALAR